MHYINIISCIINTLDESSICFRILWGTLVVVISVKKHIDLLSVQRRSSSSSSSATGIKNQFLVFCIEISIDHTDGGHGATRRSEGP